MNNNNSTETCEQDYPDVVGPAWSTKYDDPGVDSAKNPTRLWLKDLVEDKFFSAGIVRDDTFAVDTGTIIEGETVLSVWIDRNDQIIFLKPEHAREAGQKLIAAADEFEKALKTDQGQG